MLTFVCQDICPVDAHKMIDVGPIFPSNDLAAESNLRPFFEGNGLPFRDIATVLMITRKIRDLIFQDDFRDGVVCKEIEKINMAFSDGNVEVEDFIKWFRIKCSGRVCRYVVINFRKERKSMHAIFLREHETLSDAELKELGIDRKETHFLDYPGFEGVLFDNINNNFGYWGADYSSSDYNAHEYRLDKVSAAQSAAQFVFTDVVLKDDIKNAEILDCASGSGLIVEAAIKAGATKITAMDHSSQMLDVAKKRMGEKYKDVPVSYVLGDMFNLDEQFRNADGSPKLFDYITAANVLCFFNAEGRMEFFRQAWRHLKPGGKLIIIGRTMDETVKMESMAENKKYLRGSTNLHIIPDDYYKFAMKKYKGLLNRAGYKDITIANGGNEVDEDFGIELSELEVLVNQFAVISATKPAVGVEALPEEVNIDTVRVMERSNEIHIENCRYTKYASDVQGQTVLCHIVADSILPSGQKDILKRLQQKTRNKKCSEKIICLSVEDPDSEEELFAELARIKADKEIEYGKKGYQVRFDVACSNKKFVGKIQSELGMKALAFSKEGDGLILQIEGIILALRALQSENVGELLKVYKFLTGKDFSLGQIKNIDQLARQIQFVLPVTRINVDMMDKVNRLIESNIERSV